MSRQPAFPDFIDEELLRVPMTLDTVIDAVHERWRMRLPHHQPGDPDPARSLRMHRGALVAETLRALREMTLADLAPSPGTAGPAGLAPGPVPGNAARSGAGRPARPQDLALIDEDDVAVDLEIARCARFVKQEAEAELRELHTYTSALVHDLNVARETNPFGPERFARALWLGVQRLPLGKPVQVAFMHDAAEPLAETLRRAYASASQRLQAQGVEPAAYRTIVFGGGTAWGSDLSRYRPSEGLHELQAGKAAAWLAPDTPARPPPPAAQGPAQPKPPPVAPAAADPQRAELLARLFHAMRQERGLADHTHELLARLQPVILRLVQSDAAPLEAYDHPAWRLMNQLAFDIECSSPGLLARLLSLGNSLAEHLAGTPQVKAAHFTWAIVRLAAARQHALDQAVAAAGPQIARLQRIARDEASAATAAVPLDIGTLDTVPAKLLPEPAPERRPSASLDAAQASTPGTHLRCHLQGRWRHLMALWQEPGSEMVLLLEPAQGRLWALRQPALARLLAESLARPLRPRSLVRRAADRLLREA